MNENVRGGKNIIVHNMIKKKRKKKRNHRKGGIVLPTTLIYRNIGKISLFMNYVH